MAESRRFTGITSRSQLKAANNLGVITRPLQTTSRQFRKIELDVLDSYYEGRQYTGMSDWMDSISADGQYVPVRQRKPMLQLNFAKMLTSRVASKLVSRRNFPELNIEDDPETTELINLVVKQSQLKSKLMEPVRRMLVGGSCLVRFSVVNGQFKLEHFLSKWCFPEFDANDNLEFVKIQYVFEDENEKDPETKQPKKKWFRMDLSKTADILYDNPEFSPQQEEPDFKPVAQVDHGLGFVQAEWLRTSKMPNTVDGPSMIADVLGFIDELNYNFSQSSQAVSYNQDPQLTFRNMDEEDMGALIRSSVKGWNLGKEGEAAFLESTMNGVTAASDFRDRVRTNIQDIARVVMLDPEKIVGSAQSGKAMEVLHGPMVELIEELQPNLERSILAITLKLTITNLILANQGGIPPITIPPGYKPKSLNLVATWPEIFPQTMQDLQQKVQVATSAASANIISRETMTRWLAKDFGIENIEEEAAKIAAQPVINPFGGF